MTTQRCWFSVVIFKHIGLLHQTARRAERIAKFQDSKLYLPSYSSRIEKLWWRHVSTSILNIYFMHVGVRLVTIPLANGVEKHQDESCT